MSVDHNLGAWFDDQLTTASTHYQNIPFMLLSITCTTLDA